MQVKFWVPAGQLVEDVGALAQRCSNRSARQLPRNPYSRLLDDSPATLYELDIPDDNAQAKLMWENLQLSALVHLVGE